MTVVLAAAACVSTWYVGGGGEKSRARDQVGGMGVCTKDERVCGQGRAQPAGAGAWKPRQFRPGALPSRTPRQTRLDSFMQPPIVVCASKPPCPCLHICPCPWPCPCVPVTPVGLARATAVRRLTSRLSTRYWLPRLRTEKKSMPNVLQGFKGKEGGAGRGGPGVVQHDAQDACIDASFAKRACGRAVVPSRPLSPPNSTSRGWHLTHCPLPGATATQDANTHTQHATLWLVRKDERHER